MILPLQDLDLDRVSEHRAPYLTFISFLVKYFRVDVVLEIKILEADSVEYFERFWFQTYSRISGQCRHTTRKGNCHLIASAFCNFIIFLSCLQCPDLQCVLQNLKYSKLPHTVEITPRYPTVSALRLLLVQEKRAERAYKCEKCWNNTDLAMIGKIRAYRIRFIHYRG